MHIRSLSVIALATLSSVTCGGSSSEPAAPPVVDKTPSTLVAVSSTSVSGVAGVALAAPVSVRVTQRSGSPATGVVVGFSVVTGGGALNPVNATTNDQGLATTTWTLGPLAGTQSISASVSDLAPVTFTAVAAAGAPTVLSKTAGDGQSVAAGASVATVPRVRVFDATGNGIAGVSVTFSVTAGGGSVSGGVVTSGADGSAAPTAWTLGTKVGANTLTATVTGGVTATFTATAVAGSPQSLTFGVQGPSELKVGDRLALATHAFDAYGNENTTAAITYTVTPPGAVGVDSAGTLSALAAGSFTVVAKSGGASTSYSAIVIGHPAGTTIAAHFNTGAVPSSVVLTDDSFWAVATDGSSGMLTHYAFDGSPLNTPVKVESAALAYLVLAPASAGNTIVVVNTGALVSQYWFVDIAKNAIVETVSTFRYAQFGGITSDGRRAYVVLDGGELAVIDVATHQFLPSIPLGAGIENFSIAHGDSLAYAYTSLGTMFEIDLKRSAVKRQFNMPRYTDVFLSRDGTRFYVIDNPFLSVRVLQTSDLHQVRTLISTGSHVAASPDEGIVYVTAASSAGRGVQLFVGDLANGWVRGPSILAADVPQRLLFDPSGSTLFIVNADGSIDVVR